MLTKQPDSGPIEKGAQPLASELWSGLSLCELHPHYLTVLHAFIHSEILNLFTNNVQC